MAESLIGNLELIGQTRNRDNNALLQIVRRPPNRLRARNWDPEDDGDFALVYTRFLFTNGDDSLLDASTGQIWDVRMSTENLEQRLDQLDRRYDQQPVLIPERTEEEKEQADLEDFKHGVVPDRPHSPVSFLNLTDASGHSTMYVEEQDDYDEEGYHVELVGIAADSAYDFADTYNSEEKYDKAYTESFFIDYNAVSPEARSGRGTRSSSSLSHISATSVLVSRPWPVLPPLPTEGDQSGFESNPIFEEKYDTAASDLPATPTSFTGLLEGSFMASLDQQLSPETEQPGLEPIVPASLSMRRDGRNVAGLVTERIPERLHLNGTVEMPTANGPILVPTPPAASTGSRSPISPISSPPSPIQHATPPNPPVTNNPTPISSPVPTANHPAPARPRSRPGIPRFPRSNLPSPNFPTTSNPPAVPGVRRTSPIKIPSSVKPGVPGLKRRKMSPSASTSSSGSETDPRPRRSSRIKRKPRRKYSK